ncbi:capsular polysaccharide biosynthesis protein [Lacibacterium aquatile]|uniref:Capsular polysaccharide biosynthesis protein n=1 Tax=Lacibacterium aquatile TaxID=1168082 RepID=A0ABW5DTX4_9PROT
MSFSPDKPLRLGYCQSTILRKNRLFAACLPEAGALIKIGRISGNTQGVDAIIGWGRKKTSLRAMKLAEKQKLPYFAIEDGFLRSLDLGVRRADALSLLVDKTGIYYDARFPSDLETLISAGAGGEDIARAEAGMALLRHQRLSKYNAAPEMDEALLSRGDRERILVVDQTAGDASIIYGLASKSSFKHMLEAAKDENPSAEIIVKIHPDVAAGRRQGHLADWARRWNCTLIDQSCNPWSLLDRVDQVYVVTSQMGFEAAIAGLPVRCFGMPFYAGWGVTRDEVTCERRTVKRTVTDIFAAAYLHYCRYANPFDNLPSSFEETVETLGLWRRTNDENRTPIAAVGMSRWKRTQVAKFLRSTEGKAHFFDSADSALAWSQKHQGRIVVWASKQPGDLAEKAAARNVPLARMEDGFLRSVGLGADFIPASSLVVDKRGLYFDPRQPSDLEHILLTDPLAEDICARAAKLRSILVHNDITKYNVGSSSNSIAWPGADARRIFVPGQVENDRSVQFGSPRIQTNLSLLKAVRAAAPEAFIVYKPHPDVDAGHRIGAIPDSEALQYANAIARDISSASLTRAADEVHTMTSLVGFEALLRDKIVHCYGQPFYAGWGLTVDLLPVARRNRQLTLDQLVAATLILYPRYVDPVTGLPCSPEQVIERFVTGYRPPPTVTTWLRRNIGAGRRGLREAIWSFGRSKVVGDKAKNRGT